MTDNCISGNIFGQRNQLRKILLFKKQFFYAPVLVAKLNFQVQDLLTITNKPEMTWFYDPGMYWTNTNFMKFFTINRIERVIGNG